MTKRISMWSVRLKEGQCDKGMSMWSVRLKEGQCDKGKENMAGERIMWSVRLQAE